MNEEIKNEEIVEEINPVDEYLNNYKEKKLAEFCVQKDKEIASRKKERQNLIKQISDMKVTVKQLDETWKNMGSLYAEIKKLSKQISDMKVTVKQLDETWKNMDSLYAEIKKLSVNDYLRLYHMMNDDIAGNYSVITTPLSANIATLNRW